MARYRGNDGGGFLSFIFGLFFLYACLRILTATCEGAALPEVPELSPVEREAREAVFARKIQDASAPVAPWSGCLDGRPQKVVDEWRELYGPRTAPNLEEWNAQYHDYRCWKHVAQELTTRFTHARQSSGHRYTKCQRMYDRSLCVAVESQLLYPTPRGCREMLEIARWRRISCKGGEASAEPYTPQTFRKITVGACNDRLADAVMELTADGFVGAAFCWMTILALSFVVVLCIGKY